MRDDDAADNDYRENHQPHNGRDDNGFAAPPRWLPVKLAADEPDPSDNVDEERKHRYPPRSDNDICGTAGDKMMATRMHSVADGETCEKDKVEQRNQAQHDL
jgi:hypothetical protein